MSTSVAFYREQGTSIWVESRVDVASTLMPWVDVALCTSPVVSVRT